MKDLNGYADETTADTDGTVEGGDNDPLPGCGAPGMVAVQWGPGQGVRLPPPDVETRPSMIPAYNMGRGIHDVQLKNGLQNHTAMGVRAGAPSYLTAIQPTIPGQTRLIGTLPSSFVPKGGSPAQWNKHVSAGIPQDSTPGGPGQMVGNSLLNPGSGG